MMSRRSLLKGSLATLLTGVSLAGYAFGLEPHVRLRVARYRVAPRSWPAGLRLRIAAPLLEQRHMRRTHEHPS